MPHHPVATMATDLKLPRRVHANDRVSPNPTRTYTTTQENYTTRVITTTIIIHPNAVTITRSVVTKTFVAGMMLTKEVAWQKWMLTMNVRCPPNPGVDGTRI
jgi:hypothetical protein